MEKIIMQTPPVAKRQKTGEEEKSAKPVINVTSAEGKEKNINIDTENTKCSKATAKSTPVFEEEGVEQSECSSPNLN
jgi:hypothetical protein